MHKFNLLGVKVGEWLSAADTRCQISYPIWRTKWTNWQCATNYYICRGRSLWALTRGAWNRQKWLLEVWGPNFRCIIPFSKIMRGIDRSRRAASIYVVTHRISAILPPVQRRTCGAKKISGFQNGVIICWKRLKKVVHFAKGRARFFGTLIGCRKMIPNFQILHRGGGGRLWWM